MSVDKIDLGDSASNTGVKQKGMTSGTGNPSAIEKAFRSDQYSREVFSNKPMPISDTYTSSKAGKKGSKKAR